MFIKPTLARAGVLSTVSDQYARPVDNMAAMVKELDAMRYKVEIPCMFQNGPLTSIFQSKNEPEGMKH